MLQIYRTVRRPRLLRFPLWPVAFLALLLSVSTSVAALKIDAPDAAIKTSGEKIPAYFNKPEPGWVMHKNGDLGDYVAIAQPGEYTFVLRACGSPVAGSWAKDEKWPMIQITVDGRPAGEATINHDDFQDQKFPLKLAPGVHCIAVSFYNDGPTPKNLDTEGWKIARNLFISRLEIDPPAAAPENAATLSTQKDYFAANAKLLAAEDETLAAADKKIDEIRKGPVRIQTVDANNQPIPNATVEIEQTRHDFLFGCNIMAFGHFKTAAQNALYQQRFADLCNYATLGFYWRGYEPVRGQPRYADTDKVVAWCQQHSIAMKGHPLLWEQPAGIPAWSTEQPSADLQKQRITDIIERYKNRIGSWEVVNEPGHSFGGPGAIPVDDPYRWARVADPQAYLNMNDFSIFANGSPRYFAVLQKAIADGVPFDGIGIQGHDPATMRYPMTVIQQELDHYSALGKDLSVTELTPPSAGPMTGLAIDGQWTEQAQADYATRLYRTLFAHPSAVAITWWDLTDAASWRPNAGLLHKDMSPKLAYLALRKLIHETWHTHLTAQTDKDGRIDLRAFYGEYAITVTANAQTIHARFHLDRKTKDPTWTIALDGNQPRP